MTAAGMLVAFCGWGVWAAAGRGTIASPLTGLAFMLVVAAGVFVLTRFLGFLVVEQMLGRLRPHARWSHSLTGLFLIVAGVSYLANTSWLANPGEWVGDGLDWIREQWQRV